MVKFGRSWSTYEVNLLLVISNLTLIKTLIAPSSWDKQAGKTVDAIDYIYIISAANERQVPWRNRTARSTVNREVVSSILTGTVLFALFWTYCRPDEPVEDRCCNNSYSVIMFWYELCIFCFKTNRICPVSWNEKRLTYVCTIHKCAFPCSKPDLQLHHVPSTFDDSYISHNPPFCALQHPQRYSFPP